MDRRSTLEVRIRKELKDFTLNMEFSAGKGCLGILGASGCGKSMTLKSIAGIVTPDEGRIVMEGEAGSHVLYDSALGINQKPQARNVGYLFQNYALFPNMTVEENIAAGLKSRKKGRRPGREGRSAGGRERWWSGSAFPVWRNAFRPSFPEDSSRERLWPGSWPMSRRRCFWMNRFPPWMPT